MSRKSSAGLVQDYNAISGARRVQVGVVIDVLIKQNISVNNFELNILNFIPFRFLMCISKPFVTLN